MNRRSDARPLSNEAFLAKLRREGAARYHDRHPFHLRMHQGKLTKRQLQQWVLNRYYYQTRIPIKDALILSKSEDPAFRRVWIRRVRDQDGDDAATGGLDSWLILARGVGLDPDEVRSLRSVLPGVRLACDGYVQFVREASLLEAVASSLTELFAPTLMSRRLDAWGRHYPWVGSGALTYFRMRVSRADLDARHAVSFVMREATTRERQTACIEALIKKAAILWHLLDCIQADCVRPSANGRNAHARFPRQASA
ncbi:Pyrroloquinoline-quinone synthase [Nitrospira japonica]|uniref:Pyrroloquinoline-quinone synthase n=1 Tax=Nitrospira japonica TaxID=1325564 RepID=A0A1W1I2I1_9BACT|nr:pyrroloquinoline-quinone synthase PqqC [Nitrospira japonica]SLM47195.1 Pyrroloquinoline-quinone synthase [Nitrospira japonica]